MWGSALIIVRSLHPKEFFCDDRVQITSAGRRYLGGAIVCPDFLRGYLGGIDSKWLEHLERLTTFAVSQPQAAYAAFVHSLSAKWSYFQRMIPAEQSAFFTPRNRRSRTSFCRHWRVRAPYLSIPDISSLSLLVWAALETAIRWPQVRTSIGTLSSSVRGAFIAAFRATNVHVLSARRGRRSRRLYGLMGTLVLADLTFCKRKERHRGSLSFR